MPRLAMFLNALAALTSIVLIAGGINFTFFQKNSARELEDLNGAVRGINVAQLILTTPARVSVMKGNKALQADIGWRNENAGLGEPSDSFRVENGAALNDGPVLESVLFRIAGPTRLGKERIDYMHKAMMVSTLLGQNTPGLQTLAGLEFTGLPGERAKQKVNEKKEEFEPRSGISSKTSCAACSADEVESHQAI